MSGNTITNISVGAAGSTSNAVVDGILISGGTSINVFKNKIHGITTGALGVSTIVSGIRLAAGTSNTIYNNLIGNLTAPSSASTDAIRGINITSTTSSSTHNIFYNSIFLSGSGGANFGGTGIFHTVSATATTSALNLRNNIVANGITPSGTGLAVAFRRSGGAASNLANYASASNNNDFYAGTPGPANLIYTDGVSSAQTMAAYKAGVFTAGTIAPRDSASFSELPPFLSTVGANANFLHIDTTVATQVESGATPIGGITDDFDGQARNASTPDVGADEFAGIGIDLNAPAISYTPFGNGADTVTSRSLTNVTITDATGVNTTAGTRPRIYFKKSTDANTVAGNTSANNGWKFVETASVASPFTFTIDYSLLQAPVAIGDTIQYFVVAQDTSPAVNVGINSGTFAAAPASVALTAAAFPLGGTINSYNIAAAIPATLTVNSGGPITSITNASGLFATLNAGVMTQNVTVSITSDLTAETGVNVLNQLGEDGAGGYTLTIVPSGGARSITGTGSGGLLIKINGADRVTIDGSTSGGTDRSLTLNNPNTATGTGTLFIASLGTGAGANNVTIKNCIIKAGGIGSTSIFTFAVFVGDTTGAAAGADNDNLTIQNNQIMMARTGIQAVGTAAGVLDNLSINGNLIGDNTLANSIGRTGMTVQVLNNASIVNNTVKNIFLSADTSSNVGIQIVQSANSTVGFNTLTGISSTGTSIVTQGITAVTATTGLSINGNTIDGVTGSGSVGPQGISISTGVTNSTVTRNNVTNVTYTGTSGYGGKGIEINTGSAATNVTVANNFVSNIKGDCWSAGANILDTVMGIRVVGTTGGVNLYHNSVNLGSGSFVGNTQPATVSAALYIASTATTLNIRNNIIINNLDNSAETTDKNYAFYSDAANTAFTDINFNDYWVPVSSATGPQVLGFIGSDRLTLANIQTGTAKDANSISADPLLISATDLHLPASSVSPAVGAGTPIGTVTVDFDGDPRPASNTDIGADELVQASGRVVTRGKFYNASFGSGGPDTLAGDVTVTNSLRLTGMVDTGAFTLTIDCGATVTSAGGGNYIIGNVKKNFCVAGTFTFPVGTFPNGSARPSSPEGTVAEYTPMTATINSGTFPSSLTVKVNDTFMPGTSTLNSLSRHWDVTETGDLNADMTFNYLNEDVYGNENGYLVVKFESGIASSPPGSSVNPAANTFTAVNISNFSKWGAGLIPTAAGASIGGRVLDANGHGIANAQVVITGGDLTAPMMIQTGPFGYYNFTGLAVSRLYVVSVKSGRHTFAEPARAIDLSSDVTNADFVAEPAP